MTGLVRLIAFTLAAMPLPPAAAQTPATRFDADYTGKLAGPVSGQLSFKAVNGTLVGTADGTVDGRSFHGKLEGHVGDGASPALTATITGTVAAKQAATSGGGGGGTFPAEPFNRLQVTYSISGIPLGTPKDEAGFTHTRTYPVTGPSSGVIKITGKSAPFKATCNSEYGSFWFETKAVLTVGERKAPFSTKAPCDKPAGTPTYTVEQPAAEFEVMLSDVKPNEDVSFSITEVFVNPRFGNRGVMISGSRGADGGEDILTLTLEGKPVGKLASTTRTVRFEGTAKANFAGTALDGTFTAAGSPCPTTRRTDGSCPEALAQVCPSAAGGFAATGLIAAANDANAVVRYQGAPNATVRIVADHDLTGIPKTAAEVRLSVQRPDTSGKRWIEDLPDIEAQTDASGQLDVDVKLRVQNGAYTYHDAIARPGRITVRFSETDGRSAKETARVPIDVGLGAVVEVAKMASLPADDSGQARHAWRAYVKSAFHPGLDLAGYVAELSKCPLPIAVPRVAMHSWWSNDDGSGEPLNDGVGGRSVGLMQQNTDFWGSHGAVLDLARAKNGRTYLAPHDSRPPAASFDGDRLPAIAQSRDGHFVKAYFGYLIAGTDTNVASVEPRVLDRAIYVLSHEFERIGRDVAGLRARTARRAAGGDAAVHQLGAGGRADLQGSAGLGGDRLQAGPRRLPGPHRGARPGQGAGKGPRRHQEPRSVEAHPAARRRPGRAADRVHDRGRRAGRDERPQRRLQEMAGRLLGRRRQGRRGRQGRRVVAGAVRRADRRAQGAALGGLWRPGRAGCTPRRRRQPQRRPVAGADRAGRLVPRARRADAGDEVVTRNAASGPRPQTLIRIPVDRLGTVPAGATLALSHPGPRLRAPRVGEGRRGRADQPETV